MGSRDILTTDCVRGFLLAVNLIIWLLGTCVFGVGIYLRIDPGQLDGVVGDSMIPVVTWLLLIIGGFLFGIGFIGCFAALCNLPAFMAIYCVVVSALLIVELAIGIVAFSKQDEVMDKLGPHLRKMVFEDYGQAEQDTQTALVDALQVKLQCCGLQNYTDWKSSSYMAGRNPMDRTGLAVPKSCCRIETVRDGCNRGAPGDPTYRGYISPEGCLSTLKRYILENLKVVGGCAVALLLLQFIASVGSCYLCIGMRRNKGGD